MARLRRWASIARREHEPRIDTEVGALVLAALLERVENCWHSLGETAPHWSVITSPLFMPERIEETRSEFFASGEREVRRWEAAARRCGVELPLNGTCLELGCGVGRVTVWLAQTFRHVIGVDISPSHLAIAKQTIREKDCRNVDLRLINRTAAFEQLPTFDCFLSFIALQHNPPPVMRWLLLALLSKLRDGGIGLFQVPTMLPGYSFDAASYLANAPTDKQMEMHALPHQVVVDVVREAGCRLLDESECDCTGIAGAISIEFLVRKGG